MRSEAPGYGYDPTILPQMRDLALRQRAKDALFVDELTRHLRPGSVLEIGAGCGQLSEMLQARGWDVTASDIEPFLVDEMSSRGLRAKVLDAMALPSSVDDSYDNILAQGVSTMITDDLEVVRRTYTSVRAALVPGARLIVILPSPLWGGPWSRARDHLRIARQCGFELVHRFRHQALPSSFYARLPVPVLRAMDASIGRIIGVRWVFVFSARPDA